MLNALETINREFGTATALITHNASIAAMADRVVTLGDGRITGVRRNQTRLPVTQIEW